MKFINISYERFLNNIEDKKIIQFGASSMWSYYLRTFPNIVSDIVENTLFIVDNNKSKQEQTFEISTYELPVYNVEKLKTEDNYVILIVVSLAYQMDICRQLEELGLPEGTECYSLPLMVYNLDKTDNTCVDGYFTKHRTRVNEPKIHSFWFSKEEKPEIYKRCVDSWYKFCPEFEIMEWNADNYDVSKNKYMYEAFEHKKWAFVSDYARLDVIHSYGGIYMDMDVELTAPLEFLLNAERFFFRQHDGYLELGSGFGAKAGDKLIGEMLETYKDRSLFLKSGKMDKTSQPEWLSEILKKYGIYNCHDSQVIGDSLILSDDYITCYTDETSIKKARIGIHWHNGSWLDEKDRAMIQTSFAVKSELVKKYFKKI